MRNWIVSGALIIKAAGFAGCILTSTSAFAGSTPAAPVTVTCGAASAVIAVSLKAHLIYHQMTPELADRAAKMYVSWLELATDVLSQPEIDSMDAELKSADRAKLAAGLLGAECSFFEVENQILANAYNDLAGTFSTPEALRDEILAQPATPLPDSKTPALSAFEVRARVLSGLAQSAASWSNDAAPEVAADFVARYYLNTLKSKGADILKPPYALMAEAFTLSLDPHSMYHPPAEAADFLGQLAASSFSGVGIVMGQPTPYGFPIDSVVPGGPAASSSQVAKGDIITAVDGAPVAGMLSNDAVKLIKGPAGTQVVLSLARLASGTLTGQRDVQLTRAPISNTSIQVSSQSVQLRGKRIVVVQLKTFFSGAGDGVAQAIKTEAAKGRIDALVLDLRDNPGGLVDEAVNVANDFVPVGPVLAAVDTQGNRQVYRVTKPSAVVYSGPLLVAISQGSASASEIVSGALKDLGRAIVVGDPHSYGKGTMQTILNFKSLGAMAITMAQFYTSGGASTQQIGVSSQILVPGPSAVPDEDLEANNKYALPANSIAPLMTEAERFRFPKSLATVLPLLKSQSAARLATAAAKQDPKAKAKAAAKQLSEIENIGADWAAAW